MKKQRSHYHTITKAGACLGVLMGGALAHGATVDEVAQENQALKSRLEALEVLAQKEGLLPSGKPAPKFVTAMSDISISGFVQASYFYDNNNPSDGYSDGYLWNTKHNSFSINKVKLTLASGPVATDKWDAGFRTSFIWGEDAPVLNTGGENQGLEALREAYVELNAPVGTGLNVKAGQLISLLNWESGDGGAANPNFSQGYQWFYTGNGPSAGVQLGYALSEKVDVKFRVQNGMYAGAIDGNNEKTIMASVGFKPTDSIWFNVIGFTGEEAPGFDVEGLATIGGVKINDKIGTGFEVDFFNFDFGAVDGDLWSVGGWVWYDFTSTVGLALRAEYLDDSDGVGLLGIGLPNRPGSALTSTDADGSIGSLTLTLNWKPAPNVKVQPEIRYDYSTYDGAYDGEDDRITFGAGISYLF